MISRELPSLQARESRRDDRRAADFIGFSLIPYKWYGKINDPADVCFAWFLRYKFYTFTMRAGARIRGVGSPSNSETVVRAVR